MLSVVSLDRPFPNGNSKVSSQIIFVHYLSFSYFLLLILPPFNVPARALIFCFSEWNDSISNWNKKLHRNSNYFRIPILSMNKICSTIQIFNSYLPFFQKKVIFTWYQSVSSYGDIFVACIPLYTIKTLDINASFFWNLQPFCAVLLFSVPWSI